MQIKELCQLATQWYVFGPFESRDRIDITQWHATVPETVTVAEVDLLRRQVAAWNELDITPYIDGFSDGKAALIFIPFQVGESGEYTFGLGADWWFEAQIDGRAVCDTLAEGNRSWPPTVNDFHRNVNLEAGAHLLVIRLLSGSGGAKICVAAGARASFAQAVAVAAQAKTSQVDFADSVGIVKALHGINNGPLSYGGLLDLSGYFSELRIPWVRIHDSNWPNPREVDIPQIFPNEDADPEDPANYDFSRTDTYIQSIVNTGAKIVYRLGTSIEHTSSKYYIHPPKDFQRWAKICIGIIKHYNRGWANGFHHNITHWEIWNEPEGPDMWTGTEAQYLDLYAVSAAAIKQFDPALKVGGFASACPEGGMVLRFLTMCRDRKLPLDFFSWHAYASQPEKVASQARLVRERLNHYGFSSVESHLNEWNMLPGDALFEKVNAYQRRSSFMRLKNEEGASFCIAALIKLQDAGVDVTNYYDGQPHSDFCGLFDTFTVPQKTFYAFKMFQEMTAYPERVAAEGRNGVECLAAVDRTRQRAGILLAKFGGHWLNHPVKLHNFPAEINYYELLMVDQDHQMETVQRGRIGAETEIIVPLREYAVAMLRFRRLPE